jgi:polar amino acid transport system substrate-binding protein
MNTTVMEKNTKIFRIGEAVLKTIGKKIDVSFELKVFPIKRADLYIDSGKIAGDLGRVIEYGYSFPNLIRVEEPIASFPYYVYSKRYDIKVNGWASLKPYKVVYVSGTTYIKSNLTPIHYNLYPIRNVKQAIKFLSIGRADIYISNPLAIAEFIKSGELNRLGIKALEPPISVLCLYTYFHPKHQQIEKRYNQALKQIKKDGTYKRILQQTK